MDYRDATALLKHGFHFWPDRQGQPGVHLGGQQHRRSLSAFPRQEVRQRDSPERLGVVVWTSSTSGKSVHIKAELWGVVWSGSRRRWNGQHPARNSAKVKSLKWTFSFLLFEVWMTDQKIWIFFKWAIPGLFFFVFVFSVQLTVNNVQFKFCRWLDWKSGPLKLEETALPTEPQPLPLFITSVWKLYQAR